jgi:hypothetical protein
MVLWLQSNFTQRAGRHNCPQTISCGQLPRSIIDP